MNLLFLSYFTFLIRRRGTVLGILWLLVGPSLFITFLGTIYAQVGAVDTKEFIPHLTVGLAIWTLINGFIVESATVFQSARAQILQGSQSLDGIIVVNVITTTLLFLHQLPITIVVFLIFGINLEWVALECVFGILLLIANGYFACFVFGMVGARYRDLGELFNSIMRIAFLATPIIWVPTIEMEDGLIGSVLIFNPFYHFIDVIRAPLLGHSASLLSWSVVILVTITMSLVALLLKKYYAHRVVFWL